MNFVRCIHSTVLNLFDEASFIGHTDVHSLLASHDAELDRDKFDCIACMFLQNLPPCTPNEIDTSGSF